MIKKQTITGRQMRDRLLKKVNKNSLYGKLGYEDFPARTVRPVESDTSEYKFGVNFPMLHTMQIENYIEWCENTAGFSDFKSDDIEKVIWFNSEQTRTMFLLRWS